jgi:hypothetical protein
VSRARPKSQRSPRSEARKIQHQLARLARRARELADRLGDSSAAVDALFAAQTAKSAASHADACLAALQRPRSATRARSRSAYA